MTTTAKQILDLTNEAAKLTYKDLEKMNQEGGGFGYLGHEHRTRDTDDLLVDAANQMGLSYEDLFLWANSRSARHFMDGAPAQVGEFVANIKLELPGLKREVSKQGEAAMDPSGQEAAKVQAKLFKEIYSHIDQADRLVAALKNWMQDNEIDTLLSGESEDSASNIKDSLEEITKLLAWV